MNIDTLITSLNEYWYCNHIIATDWFAKPLNPKLHKRNLMEVSKLYRFFSQGCILRLRSYSIPQLRIDCSTTDWTCWHWQPMAHHQKMMQLLYLQPLKRPDHNDSWPQPSDAGSLEATPKEYKYKIVYALQAIKIVTAQGFTMIRKMVFRYICNIFVSFETDYCILYMYIVYTISANE